jgi:hypothetical protein
VIIFFFNISVIMCIGTHDNTPAWVIGSLNSSIFVSFDCSPHKLRFHFIFTIEIFDGQSVFNNRIIIYDKIYSVILLLY